VRGRVLRHGLTTHKRRLQVSCGGVRQIQHRLELSAAYPARHARVLRAGGGLGGRRLGVLEFEESAA
jgi:hypothetical protein